MRGAVGVVVVGERIGGFLPDFRLAARGLSVRLLEPERARPRTDYPALWRARTYQGFQESNRLTPRLRRLVEADPDLAQPG